MYKYRCNIPRLEKTVGAVVFFSVAGGEGGVFLIMARNMNKKKRSIFPLFCMRLGNYIIISYGLFIIVVFACYYICILVVQDKRRTKKKRSLNLQLLFLIFIINMKNLQYNIIYNNRKMLKLKYNLFGYIKKKF